MARSALVFLAVFCATVCCVAQTLSSPNDHPNFTTHQPSIQVKSNLVQVPVFVFRHDGVEGKPNVEELRCLKDGKSAWRTLSADQPYLPKRCDRGQINDLSLADFRLFQDGKPQAISSIEKAGWWLPVRDNRGWHSDTSNIPTGRWSSSDLGDPMLPNEESVYLLGYAPPATSSEDGCHKIRVEVRRPKVRLFARDEYCAGQTPLDSLNGTKIGKKLERELDQKGQGKIPLFVQAGIFRVNDGRQLTEIVLEFPWNQLQHQWDYQTGKIYVSVGVLAGVYTKEGRLVTRLSDLLWPSYWPTIVKGWQLYNADSWMFDFVSTGDDLNRWEPVWLPARYEAQLELAPGEYNLRVVLSDGFQAGRTELPLTVDSNDAQSLTLGSVFLCKRFRDAHVAEIETAAAGFAPQYVPLVSKGVQVTPAADTTFTPLEQLFAYFDINDSKVAVKPAPRVQASMRIVEAKNGTVVKDYPAVDAAPYEQTGSAIISIAREIPIGALPQGEYRLEVQASDSAGRKTPWRAAKFGIIGEKSPN